MGLGVYCECGKLVAVTGAQFERTVTCSCGFRVVVPPRVEFDRSPQLLSAATVERRVRRLLAAGELPPRGACARCRHVGHLGIARVRMECERYTVHTSGGARFLFIPFLTGFMWVRWRESERTEIRGRDTDVPSPLCLCQACHYDLRRKSCGEHWAAAVILVAAVVAAGFLSFAAGLIVGGLGLLTLVALRHHARVKRQRARKEVLRSVPIYNQILASYPGTIVVVPPQLDLEE